MSEDICDNRFSGIEDVQFRWGVSASYGKGKLKMRNFCGMYLQVIERASWGCTISMRSILMLSKMWDVDAKFAKGVSLNPRKGKMKMQLYMTGRLKSICKFEEKQVADTLIPKRASATANIKGLQIHQLPKEHLHKQITAWYRYIRHQKSKSLIAPTISTTVQHKARKRLCNPANWSRACPTKLSRSA